MSDWNKRRAAQRVLSWKTEKGQDLSINRILPALEQLQGSVLEIGPGSGNLLKYLPQSVQYSCIEPNTYLHESIRTEAVRWGFAEVKVTAGTAEDLPFPPDSFDAVVSVRSLCSMDTAVVLQEIKRVLKPGGKFVFVEHVASPKGTYDWFRQKLIKYPHKLLRGGCDPSKDIEPFIQKAGFISVKIERFNVDRDLAKARIAGAATK